MRCPQCGERETRVVDSRDLDDSATIRRRRECAACAMRFTTYERVEAARLVVVKRDGARQEFDRDRLVSGLRKALTRRPVPDGAAEAAADAIEAELRAAGVTEIPSSRIGALAMEQLRGIDQIAYIRFASVYQSFEDLEALKREVDTPVRRARDDRHRHARHRRQASSGVTSATSAVSPNGRDGKGVLPRQALRALIDQGHISSSIDIPDRNIQPASLDLTLGDVAYRLRCSFLPGTSLVREKLSEYAHGRDRPDRQRRRPRAEPPVPDPASESG